jgi:hypothetical protein
MAGGSHIGAVSHHGLSSSAAGKSDQQIADELVISLNTVRRHVSNILDKTGAANRNEAAFASAITSYIRGSGQPPVQDVRRSEGYDIAYTGVSASGS